jgi:hypothetical protein
MSGETVERLLYASLSCVSGSVFDEMLKIRDRALKRNVVDQVYAALLYQSGWFVQWMEGPPEGIRLAVRRLEGDPRHQRLRIIHRGNGPRRLTQPWSMAFRQEREELPEQFACRIIELEEQAAQWEPEPATIWRRLSLPTKCAGYATDLEDHPYQRVMVVAAEGTKSFDLVRWLACEHHVDVSAQRIAGTQSRVRDVAAEHVDVPASKGSIRRRVIAMARNGLQIGLIQAFLSDYSHVMVLLSPDTRRNMEIMHTLAEVCRGFAQRPILLGLGPAGFDNGPVRDAARMGRMIYLDCDLGAGEGTHDLWASAEPALDLSRLPGLPTRQGRSRWGQVEQSSPVQSARPGGMKATVDQLRPGPQQKRIERLALNALEHLR